MNELQHSKRAVSRLERENELLARRNDELCKENETLKRDFADLQKTASEHRLSSYQLLHESDRALETARAHAEQGGFPVDEYERARKMKRRTTSASKTDDEKKTTERR